MSDVFFIAYFFSSDIPLYDHPLHLQLGDTHTVL